MIGVRTFTLNRADTKGGRPTSATPGGSWLGSQPVTGADNWRDEPEGRLIDWLEPRLGDRPTVSSKLSVVLGKCGYQRQSLRRLTRIDQALAESGIYSRPQLSEGGLSVDDRIYFSRTSYEDWERGLRFDSESDLKEFLLKHYTKIDALADLTEPISEYRPPGSNHRVDLLFRQLRTNNMVAVELKNGDGGYGVGDQLFTYLGDLQGQAIEEGVALSGLIITTVPNRQREDLVFDQAQATDLDVTWLVLIATVEMDQRVP